MNFKEKQIAILEVAEKVISEKGFEGASIREISKRAGINLAMVSYYFGSKEKLIEALFIHKGAELKTKMKNLIEDDSLTPLERILSQTDGYLNRVFTHFNFHKIMMKEVSYLDSTVMYEQIKEIKNIKFNTIENILAEGVKQGIFNPKVDTEAVTSLIVGTFSNYALNEKYYRDRWQLNPKKTFEEQTKEKIKTQIFHSLKAILLYHE